MKAGDEVAERFVVEAASREGGMGVVHRARDRMTSEPIALKVMFATDAASAERFSREAMVLAGLTHPGIVRYLAHGISQQGEPWLAMEWLEGEELDRRLSRGPLTVSETVGLLTRVAEALGAAHAQGVVHRDIKPANLMSIGPDFSQVKVLDFGIARLSLAAGRTQTGQVLGTPSYMAPEQARAATDVDARADVFSLGCVAFECLAGRTAFQGEHVMAILAKILFEEPPRLHEIRPEVPVALSELIARMMAKDRNLRPADGWAVAKALQDSAVTASIAPPPISQPPATLGGLERRLVSVVVAAPARESSQPLADTMAPSDARARIHHLREAVAPLGAEVEELLDGSLVAVVGRGESATDPAARGARVALLLRAQLSDMAMVLATGRAVFAERVPFGEVVERAVHALRDEQRRTLDTKRVRLDEVTAGLLDARFVVEGDEDGLLLSGERLGVDSGRTLLGRDTECVGRDRELGTLAGLFEECVELSTVHAVLVTGPAGFGKSRLRHELVRRLTESGAAFESWIGVGDPRRTGSPLALLGSALRRTAGVLDGEPVEIMRRRIAARVARHVRGPELRRVTEFVGELAGVRFPEDAGSQLGAARLEPALMADQMRRAFEDLVVAECAGKPLILFLEDLHWADLSSVEFVDAVLRNVRAPLLVVALARPEVSERFPRLWAQRRSLELALPKLSRRAAERLVRDSLGDAVDDAAVTRIVERADGNAFFLEELVRATADGKGEVMPETVLAMVQARLDGVEPSARRVLRAASAFGEVFWRGGLRALTGGSDESEVNAALRTLIAGEIVVPRTEARFPGELELSFRHALIQEAAYAALTDEDRTLAHELAAAWLIRVGERDAAVVADHYERAGKPRAALDWYARAAEQAREAHALSLVIERSERAIVCGAEGMLLGTMRALQAEAHRWRGDFERTAECAAEALRCLPSGSEHWCRAAAERATAFRSSGDVVQTKAVGAELAAVEPVPGSEPSFVIALGRVAQQLIYMGEFADGRALLARMEATLPRVREARELMLAWTARGRAALCAYADGEYLEHSRRALEHFMAAGDLRYAALQRGDLGEAYRGLGMHAEAIASYRESLQEGERLGLDNVCAIARVNLAMALCPEGRLDEAEALVRMAAREMALAQNPRQHGCACAYLSIVLHLGGKVDAAREAANEAIDLLAASPPLQALALASRARIEIAASRPDRALVDAERAESILETFGQVEEGEAMVRLVGAEARHARGDLEGARRTIAQARDHLLLRAESIADPVLRQRFLGNVPDHARTLQLAEDWLAK